ncbi:hypothetical protein [Fervidibacillus albus]|uniref:37-kD nucleoid-associated bacterial protein n=1 Tax=Fervidibacillus albus TaxID=2980026 RepID=A0A9E8LW76_9BACI|nr:hypothetical protein [Fervidibacillus albus]WAA10827.1 hypothetical protein OE104_05810 [Fervidibacillus albus]
MFKRIFDSMYHIDLNAKKIERKNIGEGDLDEYIMDLLQNIVNLPDSRHYTFESDNTEVKNLIDNIILEILEGNGVQDYFSYSDKIAERLLRKELYAQEKYAHFTSLQKGSLIQSLVEYNDELIYLISKVEHESFLNAEDLVKQIGLPYEKKALKISIIKFTADYEIIDIIVFDSNKRISQYWVKDFLELNEKNSDEKNTSSAFKAVDLVLSRKLKKSSPTDYTILRNNLIGFFRTQSEFVFENMINTVFGDYEPEKPEVVDMEKIKEEIYKLPENNIFDKRFTIISKEIKAKIKKVVKISEKIDLHLKDHINQLKQVIKSNEKPDGTKVIEIKVENEQTYEMFKYRE